jgi:hypothetical protein
MDMLKIAVMPIRCGERSASKAEREDSERVLMKI